MVKALTEQRDEPAEYLKAKGTKMRNHILLGGGGSLIGGLGRAIEQALEEYGGGNVVTLKEHQYQGSDGALKIALDMPGEHWKELASIAQPVGSR